MSEFFTTAGIAVEKPQALAQVSRRLHDERGFHRDLTSHVWVMLHRRGSAVRYGETLGVVALAAAGKRLAAEADETVAHDLLRFVMEAHDGLNPPVGRTTAASLPALPVVAPIVAAETLQGESTVSTADVVNIPVPVPIARFPVASAIDRSEKEDLSTFPEAVEKPSPGPVLDTPIRFARVDVEVADDSRRKPLVWASVAGVLLVVALAGWWFYRNTSAAPEAVATPAPVIEGNSTPTPAPVVPQSGVVEQPPPNIAPIKPSQAPKGSHSPRAAEPSHNKAVSARQTYAVPSPANTGPSKPQQVAAVTPPPVGVSRPPAAAPASTTSSPASIVRSSANASKPAAPTTVSPGVLSKQLDHPGLTPQQEAEYDNTGRRYPHLLRRTPLSNSDSLMAKANVPPSFGAVNTIAGSAPAGTVRPTSLGVMSSNLIYSPAAAYPAAASAAHVAGAVKVEAVVDKSGNVAAARVISGPVQLRDAALNAVQQWRYKPYVLGGKARQFTTQALMEFELQ
ncbi:energy transducer TonB [Terriglobus sp. TAA 43]|uniref:energy transducer TonB n=1 Tax=Terriglobus sp. TAA 43 TaxID=278961 RepID=UPI0018DE89B5|nr:TonB family protein [Terriglobus sp. TAA 43]